jgi:hypothetical protein
MLMPHCTNESHDKFATVSLVKEPSELWPLRVGLGHETSALGSQAGNWHIRIS